jgi:DNA-binding transcriptional regulator/RsmH inhibitor MraZ
MIERCKIDEKWRIKIPKSWREKFNKSFEIAIVKGEGYLILYPSNLCWKGKDEVEIVGSAKIDKWKRIHLPSCVREMFSGKEILFVERKEYFEIRDYSKWKERIKKSDKDKQVQYDKDKRLVAILIQRLKRFKLFKGGEKVWKRVWRKY